MYLFDMTTTLMNTNTVSGEIVDWLKKHKDWAFGGTLERRLSALCDCKPSNVSRRLRELANEGKIKRDMEKVGRVWVVKYRTKSKTK